MRKLVQKIFTFSSVLLLLFSCKSIEKLDKAITIKSINENDLVENVLNHELSFNTLYFKKVEVSIDENGSARSVKANIFVRKDSNIIVSVLPLMGIELFRVSLDPDQIRVIDRFNRKIVVTGYEMIGERFLVEMDYHILERMLTNSLHSYPEYNPLLLKRYSAYHQDEFYSLKSLNIKRYERLTRRNSDLFLHEVNILPEIYRVTNSKVINTSTGITIETRYDHFTGLGNTRFPYQLEITATQGNKKYKVSINYNDIEIDGTNSLSFRLPPKYEVVTY